MNWRRFTASALISLGVAYAFLKVSERTLDRRLDDGVEGALERTRGRLEGEITQTLNRQVPPLVTRAIDQRLSQYGITRQLVSRADAALALADRAGLI